MSTGPFEIATDRLTLRPWRRSDAEAFAVMNADADVMADLGGPLTRSQSDAKLERFQRSYDDHSITRWVVTDHRGQFLGYAGIVGHADDHPLGAHHEIGWRLISTSWAQGYATEAARAALTDCFDRIACPEVLAYTAADNVRSQAVMTKLGLVRQPTLDFTHHYDGFGSWQGLVWSVARDDWFAR